MGEVFAGRYELVDPIGRGGVGAVWRAWDHRRRRYVAAKVLLQSDAHALLRFVREQALRIDHPHVLAPTSWAADDDKVLFTMDLVAGGSLVHLVNDYGPLPPAFVCTLLDQLLSGLAAVHAEDVVHRDVKPANVLLEATGSGRPKLRLSDFGIAMRLGEPRLTETDLVVGTPGYLAPEQMLGADPDFPADLFAVGLVALYLLEGAKPDAKALIQYFADHGTPGAPQGIPDPLWQVVATLLQPDPEARFRTATGARKALAAAVELLPDPGPDDEVIEIFDQLGPLPPGFAEDGPEERASGLRQGTGNPEGEGERTGQSPGSGGSPPRAPGETTGTGDGTPTGQGKGVAPGPRPDRSTPFTDPRHATATGSPATPPTPAPQPPSPSDTGSFPLPPPQAAAPASPSYPSPQQPSVPAPRFPDHPLQPPQYVPHPPYGHQHQAPEVSPYEPTHPLRSPVPRPAVRPDASTAEYTARSSQVPPPDTVSAQHAPGPRSHRRRTARRPGPPARVAVPVLLLALACYAVGFWALTRI